MKLYLKSELRVINGHILDEENNLIGLDAKIVDQWNRFVELHDMAQYILDQPEPQKNPSMDGYIPRKDRKGIRIAGNYDALDQAKAEAMAIMDDIDKKKFVGEMNELLDTLTDVVLFAQDDYVIPGESYDVEETEKLFNLREEDIAKMVLDCCKAKHLESGDTLPGIFWSDEEEECHCHNNMAMTDSDIITCIED